MLGLIVFMKSLITGKLSMLMDVSLGGSYVTLHVLSASLGPLFTLRVILPDFSVFIVSSNFLVLVFSSSLLSPFSFLVLSSLSIVSFASILVIIILLMRLLMGLISIFPQILLHILAR